MFNSLSGKRTYIIATLIGVLSAVHFLGYIDANMYQTLLGILTGGGLAALRAAVPTSQE